MSKKDKLMLTRLKAFGMIALYFAAPIAYFYDKPLGIFLLVIQMIGWFSMIFHDSTKR